MIALRSLLFLLLLVAAQVCVAQIGISPSYFDLTQAEAQRTQSFRLTNFGAEPVRIRTELVPFDIDGQGDAVEIEPNDRSLERHLAVSPIEFEIPPRGQQVVRFSLRPVESLVPGEYRHMVYFRFGGMASVGGQVSFPLSYRIGGAVYVQVGDPDRSATVERIETVDGREVAFDLRSTGTSNARMQGRYVVWEEAAWAEGRELPPLPQQKDLPQPEGIHANGALPGRPVLPGKTVRYTAPLADGQQRLPAGDYVLHVSGTLEGTPLERVIPFKVSASPPQ